MDTPETLAADLARAAGAGIAAAQAVVRKSALTIKNEAKANVGRSAPKHNAGAASAITYETKFAGTNFQAEIGYDKDRRGGPLGNLLEFGGGGDHSPPHRDLGRALDAEEPRFELALGAAIEKLL